MKTMSLNHPFSPHWAHRTSFHILIQDGEPRMLFPSFGTLHILSTTYSLCTGGCLVEFIMMEFYLCLRSIPSSASHVVINIQMYAVHRRAHVSHHTSFTTASNTTVCILEMP